MIKNETVFPRIVNGRTFGGMTLRQYYAGEAMKGLLSNVRCPVVGDKIDGASVAKIAWTIAGIMIEHEDAQCQ